METNTEERHITFTAVFLEADEGGYIGYVEELPGANAQGETLEETRTNLAEAVTLLLQCYKDETQKGLGEKFALRESLRIS